MKTQIERAENRLAILEDSLSHYENLIEALGNPAEWKYTGEMLDAGEGVTKSIDSPRCACGHPIRFIFFIEHPKKGQTQLGSTCIGHFETVNPSMYAGLTRATEEMENRLKEDKCKAKEIRQVAEIVILKAEYDRLKNRLEELAEEYRLNNYRNPRPVPYLLWQALHGRGDVDIYGPPEYKKKSAYLQFYRKNIKKMEQLLNDPEEFLRKNHAQ